MLIQLQELGMKPALVEEDISKKDCILIRKKHHTQRRKDQKPKEIDLLVKNKEKVMIDINNIKNGFFFIKKKI